MYLERLLIATLVISTAVHIAVLSQNTSFSLSPFFSKKETKIEVTYLKPRVIKEKRPSLNIRPVLPNKSEPFLKIPSKITVDNRVPPAYLDKEKFFNQEEKQFNLRDSALMKPALVKLDVISIRKKISLPPVDLDKINNPSYISYYQIVREKIRRAAYQNYIHADTGEVYITFVISNDGYLRESRLVAEKSTAAGYLREIALKSVKDASPFPNFPKELDYRELSFNVVISFEIE
ncbi:MAG: energy transducer TonB [Candidatus Omnitrophota bacterium]|jgi:TonB family protein